MNPAYHVYVQVCSCRLLSLDVNTSIWEALVETEWKSAWDPSTTPQFVDMWDELIQFRGVDKVEVTRTHPCELNAIWTWKTVYEVKSWTKLDLHMFPFDHHTIQLHMIANRSLWNQGRPILELHLDTHSISKCSMDSRLHGWLLNSYLLECDIGKGVVTEPEPSYTRVPSLPPFRYSTSRMSISRLPQIPLEEKDILDDLENPTSPSIPFLNSPTTVVSSPMHITLRQQAVGTQISIRAKIVREAAFYVNNTMITLLALVLISFTNFFLSADDSTGGKVQNLLSIIGCLIQIKMIIAFSFPQISYNTYFDTYYYLCFLILVLGIAQTVFGNSVPKDQLHNYNYFWGWSFFGVFVLGNLSIGAMVLVRFKERNLPLSPKCKIQ